MLLDQRERERGTERESERDQYQMLQERERVWDREKKILVYKKRDDGMGRVELCPILI